MIFPARNLRLWGIFHGYVSHNQMVGHDSIANCEKIHHPLPWLDLRIWAVVTAWSEMSTDCSTAASTALRVFQAISGLWENHPIGTQREQTTHRFGNFWAQRTE